MNLQVNPDLVQRATECQREGRGAGDRVWNQVDADLV